jgi:pyroglutamyl-peptidase
VANSASRILISGFEPFGSDLINPSQWLMNALENRENDVLPVSLRAGHRVRTIVLPVVYEKSFLKLKSEIEIFKPHVVLCFGQAAGRASIEFERFALNIIDSDQSDNDGVRIRDKEISAHGATAYQTNLPIEDLVRAVGSVGVPAKISNSAGTYVCNELFYRLQEFQEVIELSENESLQSREPVFRSGFIHLPYVTEQVATRPGLAALDFKQMKSALNAILNYFTLEKK